MMRQTRSWSSTATLSAEPSDLLVLECSTLRAGIRSHDVGVGCAHLRTAYRLTSYMMLYCPAESGPSQHIVIQVPSSVQLHLRLERVGIE